MTALRPVTFMMEDVMLAIWIDSPRRVRALLGGPSGPQLQGFAQELYRVGYARITARRHLRAAEHFVYWSHNEGVGEGPADERIIQRFDRHLTLQLQALASRSAGTHRRGSGRVRCGAPTAVCPRDEPEVGVGSHQELHDGTAHVPSLPDRRRQVRRRAACRGSDGGALAAVRSATISAIRRGRAGHRLM